ncbi:universal stress protein [Streptomyces sp. SAS_272]|uniref:universal stress protein n=1 Tax=Streptomyces sp. SAS_272 TaxID=3412747 RepID=UPI00403C214E
MVHVWEPVPEPMGRTPLLGAETHQHRTERIYPDVEVVEESRYGSPAVHVVDASREASLVVGRRVRRSPLGAHIGHVTHAALHHSTAPVAVVAHD